MIVINAKECIIGRVATFAAKQALLGETIAVVNCEQAVMTGRKKWVLTEFKRKRDMGTWATGPFYHRQPDRLFRRMIRGMLPHKQERGKSAYQRIMCYLGVPEQFRNEKLETVSGAHISKVPNLRYVTLQDIAKHLGAKRVGDK